MEKWNSRTFQDCANPEYERQRRRTKASLSYTSNLALALDPNPHFWIFNSVSVGPTHLHLLRFEYLFTLRLRVAETYLICDDPLQLEGDVKEPVTLFEKSRGRRPRCHDGVSDLCRNRSGWARCDQHMDWRGCKSAPLHADVRSHLSGSSEIQPLAASEESWHRLFFNFFIQDRSGTGLLRYRNSHQNHRPYVWPKALSEKFSCRRKISGTMWAYRSVTAHKHLQYRYTTITSVTFSSCLKSYSWHPTTICINSSGWKNSCHV